MRLIARRRIAAVALGASVLTAMTLAGCGARGPYYNGVGTTTPVRFATATLHWVVSGTRATGTLEIQQSDPPLGDLSAGTYGIEVEVSGPTSNESFRGSLTSGARSLAVTGSTRPAPPDAIPNLVLSISLPGGDVWLYLHPEVPGTYSGSVVGPPIDAMLSWELAGTTATGQLTIGAHPAGTFPLASGSYPVTLAFTNNDFVGTIRDGSRSLHAYGQVGPDDVVLTLSVAASSVSLTFRSVGPQSYTGYDR